MITMPGERPSITTKPQARGGEKLLRPASAMKGTSTMKLWGGRFRGKKETDGLVNDFNSSIQFDGRMYREDIAGSLAHAAMLGQCGIISQERTPQPSAGLGGHPGGYRGGKGGTYRRQRGHPHERGDPPHRQDRRRRQAAPHRPQPQRPGGGGPAAVPAPGDGGPSRGDPGLPAGPRRRRPRHTRKR